MLVKKTLCFDDFQCCPITVINFDDIEEVDIISALRALRTMKNDTCSGGAKHRFVR